MQQGKHPVEAEHIHTYFGKWEGNDLFQSNFTLMAKTVIYSQYVAQKHQKMF